MASVEPSPGRQDRPVERAELLPDVGCVIDHDIINFDPSVHLRLCNARPDTDTEVPVYTEAQELSPQYDGTL